jgi:hypothetical protein
MQRRKKIRRTGRFVANPDRTHFGVTSGLAVIRSEDGQLEFCWFGLINERIRDFSRRERILGEVRTSF